MRYVINAVPYVQSNVGDGACQHPALLNSIADTSIFCLPCVKGGVIQRMTEGLSPIKCDLSHRNYSLFTFHYSFIKCGTS